MKFGWKQKKWVPAEAKKAYAYMTIKQARENFIARNKTRKKILEYQLNNVEQSLEQIKTFYKNHK